MKLYDKDYDDNDYNKMMEEAGKMLNQFEFLKKKIETEYEEILKIKLIPEDNFNMSVLDYEEMLQERNSLVFESHNNLKKVEANINYLKDVGFSLLVNSGLMTEEDYQSSKFLNFLLDSMDEKSRDLLLINTLMSEYNELKYNREIDMLIVTEDSSSNKNYKVGDLEDKYNEDSEELEYIDKALFELDLLRGKLINDLGALAYFLTPKEEKNKIKRKKKGE